MQYEPGEWSETKRILEKMIADLTTEIASYGNPPRDTPEYRAAVDCCEVRSRLRTQLRSLFDS